MQTASGARATKRSADFAVDPVEVAKNGFNFLRWLATFGFQPAANQSNLDGHVCEFIGGLLCDGREQTIAGCTLSGLQLALRRRHILRGSWGLYRTRDLSEKPRRASRVLESLLVAIAITALHGDLPDIILILLVAYSGFLRTMGALTLQRWQLEFGV